MTRITGIAKFNTGLIQLEMLNPELNHTTISESRCQRDIVISTAKNKASDKIIGKYWTKLSPSMVTIASFGIAPRAATLTNKPERWATTIPNSMMKAANAVMMSSCTKDFLNNKISSFSWSVISE